ncbi:hypothetical protein [Streptomyces sp. NPDC059489]|uniref:hypothetical protein n=1 Tax=Streptomyces sp. NPDC059489 TaxID=3346849 RepID=UPI00369013A0
MTDTSPQTPPTAAHYERPFTGRPGRWEKERARAERTGHVRNDSCSDDCEPVLVHERTRWGWLAWTVPGDGSLPEIPHQIGVLSPAVHRLQRQAVHWLTRRPAQRIALGRIPASLRLSVAAVGLVSLFAGLYATWHGIPVGVALPAMALAPLLVEHLPDLLDARAGEHVRVVEGDGTCRYLQRLAALHNDILQAAAGSDRYELRRSAEIGQHLLWDTADLLQTRDTRAASADLIARERLMLQLAHQAAQILNADAEDGAADANHAAASDRPLGPHSPAARPTTNPTARRTPTPLQKGTSLMTQSGTSRVVPGSVYFLFVHEPYYPAVAQEINTTVVAAASLLHPRVRQPDGARIHDLLVRGRRPGEIVPLSTLTHELDGGTCWPEVGDWEAVTEDLLQLVRERDCDALNLCLPDIARALVCAGPRSEVRAVDPKSGNHRAYGPSDRVEVLVEVSRQLAWAAAGSPLWPGDGLLVPLNSADES